MSSLTSMIRSALPEIISRLRETEDPADGIADALPLMIAVHKECEAMNRLPPVFVVNLVPSLTPPQDPVFTCAVELFSPDNPAASSLVVVTVDPLPPRDKEFWPIQVTAKDGTTVTVWTATYSRRVIVCCERWLRLLARPAAAPPVAAAPPAPPVAPGPAVGPPGPGNAAGYLACADLARRHGVPEDRLRKVLERWRHDHDDGYMDIPNPKPRTAKYLYLETAVMPILARMKNRSS
jgi:hypothetical protein